ncbi:hypothetical protein N9N67_04935 [Bacteriovoracaceae bacterium]|nr:hypothetical protein [Bacteriovoracaceae bacterium]
MAQKFLLNVFLTISLFYLTGYAQEEDNLQKIVSYHNMHGGSTFDVNSGENYKDIDAYAVAIFPDYGTSFEGKYITVEDLESFLVITDFIYNSRNESNLLANNFWSSRNYLVGSWYDEENSQTWIEVTRLIFDLEEAMKTARQYDQRYIYHLRTGKTIKVKPSIDNQ